MTAVRLSRTHHPVTTLGHGVRAGCAGCISQDTWPSTPDSAVPVGTVLAWLAGLPGPLDGLTVSGGEPFQQPEALAALLSGVRASFGPGFDLLVYTGYAQSRLRRDTARRAALELCDAIVAGPYVERLNVGQRWQGSRNQRLIPLTDLGRQRYGDVADDLGRPRLQIGVERERIWAVGIPRRGDMARLETRLRSAGITLGEVSWHS
jgi:anaerobic ribonucleoside-triphosphate reductase activating protein